MLYYFIYIGIELLLYLTILKAIEKGTCKGKVYQKFLLFLLFWMVAFAMQNVKMREQMSVCIILFGCLVIYAFFLKIEKVIPIYSLWYYQQLQ